MSDDMKMVILMYLKEDEGCVSRLLERAAVPAYSRLTARGHGPGGVAGWYGATRPYESELVMSILPDDRAAALLEAVAECRQVEDPDHPIRAVQLRVEEFVNCRERPDTGPGNGG
jgi:hypothetical protein